LLAIRNKEQQPFTDEEMLSTFAAVVNGLA
jgi:hypothetical protein